MRLMIALLGLSILCGCSATQVRQVFVGYSIDDVKNSKNKRVQSFDMSASDCVDKIENVLKKMDAVVRENGSKQFILADNFQKAFRSSIDTTQVGIIVTPKEKNKCDVEIASSNIDLAVFVSNEISKKLKPNKEQAAVNESGLHLKEDIK